MVGRGWRWGCLRCDRNAELLMLVRWERLREVTEPGDWHQIRNTMFVMNQETTSLRSDKFTPVSSGQSCYQFEHYHLGGINMATSPCCYHASVRCETILACFMVTVHKYQVWLGSIIMYSLLQFCQFADRVWVWGALVRAAPHPHYLSPCWWADLMAML